MYAVGPSMSAGRPVPLAGRRLLSETRDAAPASGAAKTSVSTCALDYCRCGVTGVLLSDEAPDNEAVGLLYDALLALQHRGQDAAGIVTEDAGRLCLRKDMGMVRDVFTPDHILNLRGSMGIGHVR